MKRHGHTMDTVFALVLFALFAISSMLLVLLGARVYGKIAEKMQDTDSAVILSYLTEKIRRFPGTQVIQVKDGNQILLQESTEQGIYVTWIYEEDGYLKETLMPEGQDPLENAGTKIAAIQKFEVSYTTSGLLQLNVTDQKGSEGERWICLAGTAKQQM